MSTYSFTGNKVSFTYQRLLQISDGGDGNPTGIIYDGYGATVTIANENINNLYTTVNNLINNGIAGSTGATGVQGWQGPQGFQGAGGGSTGNQGDTGPQGFQGAGGGLTGNQGDTGPQGDIGFQGETGPQGFQGDLGPQGFQGNTGPQGETGPQGFQGPQGETGPQGFQGPSGVDGFLGGTGPQGNTGPQGEIGPQGFSGPQGNTGANGQSTSYYRYNARTNIQSGNPGNTNVIWNNITQISATQINISHINQDNIDIDIFLALIQTGNILILQDANNSTNYQQFLVTGTITIIPNLYVQVPVIIITSGGQGTTNYNNGHNLILGLITQGAAGPQGITGPQGETGPQGVTGPQGFQGAQGETGPQGNTGTQGITGPQGNYSPFYFQDTAPSTSLPIGSRWLDSSTGEELVLVNDGGSIQWVQPYNGSGSGGGSGGGAGTQGPQGVTGTIGNTGPQGDIGPQGAAGGGSSYLYVNVAFVHPDGDDVTAVIGDKGLPFQTIAGAFAALTAASLLNAVIEVWPGTVYSASTYDYNETTPLTLSFNLTLYLKPNVRISFNGGGSKGSQTPFFTVSANKIFKIVSDDSDSSIYISSSSANCLLEASGSCDIYIENISLYIYPRLGAAGPTPGINLVGSGAGKTKSPRCTLKNVYYEILDANDPSGTLFGFQVLNGARLNVHDCKLVFNSDNTSTSKSDNYFFYIKTIGSLNIHNTQTLFYVTTDVSAAPDYGVVLTDSSVSVSEITMDNCVHWIDDNATFTNYVLSGSTPFNVSLVGRSIHNYGSTDDGGATYITGVASSKGSIGLLDKYATIFQPFEQK